MDTKEVAKRFYELALTGNWEQIQNELFSKDAKSIEHPIRKVLNPSQALTRSRKKENYGRKW